jgi:acyl carrier protein
VEKNKIDKKISEIIQKKTPFKIKRMSKNDDLYSKKIIDSFDMIAAIQEIESFFKIKIKIEKLKKFKFSINYLSELILKNKI